MKTIFTFILFVIAFSNLQAHDDKKAKTTKEKEGKCTGSANCRSCKNCKYCAHCNSGGSCGVCSSGYSETKPAKTNKYTTTNISEGTKYMVSSNTLNIRKSAATDAAILCTLKLGDIVTYIASAGIQWIKVEAICSDGTTFTGYAYKKLLTAIGE
ncbi:MAG: SH3 domain-containing protein [Bacteroidetes bacterium]|nr:SH3 domain-containing protein [Bacteroidota bacterium]